MERLQHLLTDAAWDPQALDEARVKRLLERHPVSGGILILDDTGIPKKGSASVGVAAQYSGTLGKIDNCQVVVSAEFLADDPKSSTPFHWPVSAQLFLPESWVEDLNRREQAHVPEEITQQTKHEIALALVDRAIRWGVPVQTVVADAGYGDNPKFLRGLDAPVALHLCGGEHVWLSAPPRSAGGGSGSSPSLSRTRAASQASSCTSVQRQRTHCGAARLGLANRHLARGHQRTYAAASGGPPGPLGHRLNSALDHAPPGPHRTRRLADRRASPARS